MGQYLTDFRKRIAFHRIVPILLIITAIIQGGIYLGVFPPWQAPDEPIHFLAVEMLVKLDKWADEEDYRATPLSSQFVSSLQQYKFWYYRRTTPPPPQFLVSKLVVRDLFGAAINSENYPPLYYLILSVFYRLAPDNIITKLYILRAISVLLLAVVIFMNWQISNCLFPQDKILAVSVPVMLLFLPMHIHINSVVSADILAELFSTAIFLTVILGFKHKFSITSLALVIFLLIGSIYTKRTTLFMIPAVVAALMLYFLRRNSTGIGCLQF